MKKQIKKTLDSHTKLAVVVAKYDYFIVSRESLNENCGLLAGTGVKKLRDPVGRPSRYWDNNYWNVLVQCPNGETRKVCCDALRPASPSVFYSQKKVFPQVA
jgi:hypothetical protein